MSLGSGGVGGGGAVEVVSLLLGIKTAFEALPKDLEKQVQKLQRDSEAAAKQVSESRSIAVKEKAEGSRVLAEAKQSATKIVSDAKAEARRLVNEAKADIMADKNSIRREKAELFNRSRDADRRDEEARALEAKLNKELDSAKGLQEKLQAEKAELAEKKAQLNKLLG